MVIIIALSIIELTICIYISIFLFSDCFKLFKPFYNKSNYSKTIKKYHKYSPQTRVNIIEKLLLSDKHKKD